MNVKQKIAVSDYFVFDIFCFKLKLTWPSSRGGISKGTTLLENTCYFTKSRSASNRKYYSEFLRSKCKILGKWQSNTLQQLQNCQKYDYRAFFHFPSLQGNFPKFHFISSKYQITSMFGQNFYKHSQPYSVLEKLGFKTWFWFKTRFKTELVFSGKTEFIFY